VNGEWLMVNKKTASKIIGPSPLPIDDMNAQVSDTTKLLSSNADG